MTKPIYLPEFIFNNSKIIDRSDHWSLLLFKEALAIRRFKPELNHGTKASKDLIIFNYVTLLYIISYLCVHIYHITLLIFYIYL